MVATRSSAEWSNPARMQLAARHVAALHATTVDAFDGIGFRRNDKQSSFRRILDLVLGTEILEVERWRDAEQERWIAPEEFPAITNSSGQTVHPFDARDLRIWLRIAETADVPHVPARQVLSVLPDEIRQVYRSGPGREAILGKSMSAMDDVPDDWLVRGHLGASSVAWTCATLGISRPDASLCSHEGSLVEFGPGWMRVDGRKQVDLTDTRILVPASMRLRQEICFLARPAIPAHTVQARDDSGRSWGCEWRVMVCNGQVTGVANRHGPGRDPGDALPGALAALQAARRIVEAATDLGLVPRDLEIEAIRRLERNGTAAALHARAVRMHPRDGISCSLDFIETPAGDVLFLDGGPPHLPFGGADPCAFAGYGIVDPDRSLTCLEGIAVRPLPGVDPLDRSSWRHVDPEGCILGLESGMMSEKDSYLPSIW